MVNTDNLPAKLRETGLFCCWRYEERDGKQTKVPYNPHTGGRAQSTNPQTFAPLPVALEALERERYDGIGVGIFGNLGAIDITSEEGRPLPINEPYKWLERFCKRSGQRFLGLHAFRHLAASLMIGGGADVRTAAAVLGHSRASTTLDIYAHSFETAQDRACEIMDALLGSGRAVAK